MPRYFFDCDADGGVHDLTGRLFPDVMAARLAAIELAGEILRRQAEQGDPIDSCRLTVRDEADDVLFDLRFRSRSGRAGGLQEDWSLPAPGSITAMRALAAFRAVGASSRAANVLVLNLGITTPQAFWAQPWEDAASRPGLRRKLSAVHRVGPLTILEIKTLHEGR